MEYFSKDEKHEKWKSRRNKMRGRYLHGFGWSEDATTVYPFIILETQTSRP